MKMINRTLPFPLLPLLLAASGLLNGVHAQSGVIVDPKGGPGTYKTINAALAVTSNTDIIRVRKGVYNENIVLINRAANIVGIGLLRTDVQVNGTIGIRNHPAAHTSRFARMTTGVVNCDSSSGNLAFEDVSSATRWSFVNHSGMVSLSRCLLTPATEGPYQLQFQNVQRAFMHQCNVYPLYRNSYGWFPMVFPGTVVNGGNFEASRCSFRGTKYGSILQLYTNGGHALELTDTTARITGLANDQLLGGDGLSATFRLSYGGSGLAATRSTVMLQGVTVKAGIGASPWTLAITNNRSTITTPTTKLPVVQSLFGFVRGGTPQIKLFGEPNANSLTWLSLNFAPIQLPFGYLLVDPFGPVLTFPATLDPWGHAKHSLDLRGLPPTFTGAPYILQAITLTPNNIVGLSSPQIGAIAR